MKKFLIFFLFLFSATALFAQKTINVAVWNDLSVPALESDGDSRTGYLLLEYFKSELATHSGIKIVQSKKLTENMEKAGFKRGVPFKPAWIAALCKNTGASFFCAVRIARIKAKDTPGGRLEAYVAIYDSKGQHKGTVKRSFRTVKQSDMASILLARDAAVAIRGRHPVDDMNLVRIQRQAEAVADPRIRAELKENRDAVR